MTTRTCKATGFPLAGWHSYTQEAIEYQHTIRETTPDGTSHVWVQDAGLFCGASCLARWLAGPQGTVLHDLPCDPLRDVPADEPEPF